MRLPPPMFGNTILATRTAVPAPVSHEAVATFLTPLERQRVDAAGEGCYTTLHRESIDEVLTDLRTQRVSAVLVSVAKYSTQHAPGMARLVREFPRVPAVALLTANEPRTTQSLLALGQQGVRALVKVWPILRRPPRLSYALGSGSRSERSPVPCVPDCAFMHVPDASGGCSARAARLVLQCRLHEYRDWAARDRLSIRKDPAFFGVAVSVSARISIGPKTT